MFCFSVHFDEKDAKKVPRPCSRQLRRAMYGRRFTAADFPFNVGDGSEANIIWKFAPPTQLECRKRFSESSMGGHHNCRG